MKELTDKQKQESVAAVREYITNKKGNENRHKAFVKTSEKEESYPVVLFAEVSEKTAKVIVEWNGSSGRDYPTDFLSSNSIFQFHYGILHIESEDLFGRKISVSINRIT